MSKPGAILLVTLALILSSLACRGGVPELRFSPAELPAAQAGRPYAVLLSVTKNSTPVGDMYVETGQLPPGMELIFSEKTETGELSGVPEQAGEYRFTVAVWCFGTNISGQTGQKEYLLVVE